MTKDFISTAQSRRRNALTKKENRELSGEALPKVNRLPALTQSHIDALFQTSTLGYDRQNAKMAA